MARTKRATAVATPAPEPEPLPDAAQAAAEEQAAADRALLEALGQRENNPPTRRATIADNFINAIQLIAQAKRQLRLNEQTLVKVYELNLLWAIQNRSSVDTSSLYGDDPTEVSGGEGDAEGNDLPIPDEILGDAPSEE